MFIWYPCRSSFQWCGEIIVVSIRNEKCFGSTRRELRCTTYATATYSHTATSSASFTLECSFTCYS